jgi:hypothetical protein
LNECTESRAGFGRGTALGPAWIALLGLLGFLGPPSLQAQEMEPRNYSPAPVGLRLAGLGYGESRGDINFDPSLAVENAEATIGVTMGFFASTFAMFDRPWRVSVLLPYFDGELTGRQGGVDRRIARYGPGDARLSLAVTFAGLEPLSPAEFARREKRTTWGASLTVAAPTGEYDPNLLINIGANRWSIKSEIGVSHPVGNWTLEAALGTWIFGDNTDFAGGATRSQDPLSSFQAHVGYTFRPGLWLAATGTWYTGGRTSVDGQRKRDFQSNSRVGLTLGVPLTSHQSLKLVGSKGVTTRIGNDFDSWLLVWQYRWFRATD